MFSVSYGPLQGVGQAQDRRQLFMRVKTFHAVPTGERHSVGGADLRHDEGFPDPPYREMAENEYHIIVQQDIEGGLQLCLG